PENTQEEKLHNSILIYFCLSTGLAGFIWGSIYWMGGSFIAGCNPIGYGFFSLINLFTFVWTKNVKIFRFTQTFFMLILPFVLQWSLGGFAAGSAVMIWALVAPIISLMISGAQAATPWFNAFLILTIISGFLDPYLVPYASNLPVIIVTTLYTITIMAMGCVVFFLLQLFSRQRDAAQKQSENLLLTILPKSIAERLKEEPGKMIADRYENVSIMFADLVGFTPLSEKLSPEEIVEILNEMYTNFDSICENYRVEKIRTIGDGYMAVCGAPVENEDHAFIITSVAIEIRDYLLKNNLSNKLHIRIGINSGSAIAAIVGKARFHFDLWGDSVNIAARMESLSEPDKIQIAKPTFNLIKEKISCTYRGKIPVKGKGEMETWFVDNVKV
ncbi:MAG: adenylate/guanylate cyclase domain-containing protein, partial [Leptospiraceae bacterium]|nr:adenylate/guanylate cyclase domain-containing protein [Leptospiraceae bacterium]